MARYITLYYPIDAREDDCTTVRLEDDVAIDEFLSDYSEFEGRLRPYFAILSCFDSCDYFGSFNALIDKVEEIEKESSVNRDDAKAYEDLFYSLDPEMLLDKFVDEFPKYKGKIEYVFQTERWERICGFGYLGGDLRP